MKKIKSGIEVEETGVMFSTGTSTKASCPVKKLNKNLKAIRPLRSVYPLLYYLHHRQLLNFRQLNRSF